MSVSILFGISAGKVYKILQNLLSCLTTSCLQKNPGCQGKKKIELSTS